MKVSPEITVNRPSYVDQERTSLGKFIVPLWGWGEDGGGGVSPLHVVKRVFGTGYSS